MAIKLYYRRRKKYLYLELYVFLSQFLKSLSSIKDYANVYGVRILIATQILTIANGWGERKGYLRFEIQCGWKRENLKFYGNYIEVCEYTAMHMIQSYHVRNKQCT